MSLAAEGATETGMGEQADAWLKEATRRLDKGHENTWDDPADAYGAKSYD